MFMFMFMFHVHRPSIGSSEMLLEIFVEAFLLRERKERGERRERKQIRRFNAPAQIRLGRGKEREYGEVSTRA